MGDTCRCDSHPRCVVAIAYCTMGIQAHKNESKVIEMIQLYLTINDH